MATQVSILTEENTMTPTQIAFIKWYLITVLLVVLFVPWTDPKFHVVRYGYGLLFFRPNDAAVVDYGMVFLELIAVTCITGLIWLIRHRRAVEKP